MFFDKVIEGMSIEYGIFGEEIIFEFKVEIYVKMFVILWNMIVNDDLGVFMDFLWVFVDVVVGMENVFFFVLFLVNVYGGMKLSDDKNLFYVDYGNKVVFGVFLSVVMFFVVWFVMWM